MSPHLGSPRYSLGTYTPEELDYFDDLIEAAETFARQFGVDREMVLREVSASLLRRVEFDRLKERFGVSFAEH